jgi:uncharacterized Ntn-hydrolase superfamily protein
MAGGAPARTRRTRIRRQCALANEAVPAALRDAVLAAPDAPLAERLLLALAAGETAGGEAAGGERVPVTSAALRVAWREGFPAVDLRIDPSAAPLHGLRSLWAAYAPGAAGVVQRAVAPDDAPVL